VGFIGRSRALQVTHLRVRVGEAGAGEGRTAVGLRRGIKRAGRQGRAEKAAGENPHRNAELLKHLLDGGEQLGLREREAAAVGLTALGQWGGV
jgi:hypothetical protein